MKGWLRSWKLCEVSPMAIGGVSGWKKRRLIRAKWLIPPGNFVLKLLDSGCHMAGPDWPRHEIETFSKAHPEMPAPRPLDETSIWLPHLPGEELKKSLTPESIQSAFEELGRFHRLGEKSIHGDPHAGNFLVDPQTRRCRIIDFETRCPAEIRPNHGRARDFAILTLDLWHRGQGVPGDFRSWRAAYGENEEFCPLDSLFTNPPRSLRFYWQLLGYDPPRKFRQL